MKSVKYEIAKEISEKTKLDSPSTIADAFTTPPSPEQGDLALPCFTHFSSLAQNPKERAKLVSEILDKAKADLPIIGKVEHIGAYVNIFLDRPTFVSTTLSDIVACSFFERLKTKEDGRKRYLVEFCSANIAKPLHIGHLRTTLIGHSLVQMLKFCGHKVHSSNYLGDWGSQFGFVYAGYVLSNHSKNTDIRKASLSQILDWYIQASSLRKEQDKGLHKNMPNVKEMAYDYFVRLQKGDPEAVEFWKACVDITMDKLNEIFNRLGICFDDFIGESAYAHATDEVLDILKEAGILEESQGEYGVDCDQYGFYRLISKDGRPLYSLRDIAAALDRDKRLNPDYILYVVGAQQSLHFKRLIKVFEKMGHKLAQKIKHIAFGNVPGISTREGKILKVEDFLDEALDRAMEKYLEARHGEEVSDGAVRDISEKIAVGATFFHFLHHKNAKDFQFDWNRALNFQGDSGPYCQYAVARINSIERKANEAGLYVPSEITHDLVSKLDENAFMLVKRLSEFEEAYEKALTEFEPFYIADYALNLSKDLAKSYNVLRVLGEEKSVAEARLLLFSCCKSVLTTALSLIGVPVLKHM